MKSRFLTGAVLLGAVAVTIGGSAIAQRAERLQQVIERAKELRGDQAADPNATPIRGPGDYRFSLVYDGMTREYLVHVPRSYHGAPAPMLIALHGGGGDADFQADDSKYRLISKSEQAGFVAVFPNGYSRFPSGMLATWNAGSCCGAAERNNVDDIGFIREVIHRVERQANIDPKRVFATGMSNGAMMTWRLACEAPEVRAIAPVEGTDNTAACKPAHPVPVIEFHAADDPNVPFAGGVGVGPSHTAFASVPATQAKWVQLDHADSNARRVPSPARIATCTQRSPGALPSSSASPTRADTAGPAAGLSRGASSRAWQSAPTI